MNQDSNNGSGAGKRPKGSVKAVRRALSYLRPYWKITAGAYAAILVTNAISVYQPMVIRTVIDSGIRAGVVRVITIGAIQLLVLTAVRGFLTFISGRWTEQASQGVAYDLRNLIHRKLQSLSFSYHDRAESGQLLGRAVSDVDRVRFLTGRAVLRLATAVTLVLGVGAAMFALNARLALVTMAITPVMAVLGFRYGAQMRPISREVQQKEAVLMTHLEQNLRGARTVKAFSQDENEIERFRAKNMDLYGFQLRTARLSAVFSPLMNAVVGAGTLLVLVYGGVLTIRGALTIGELVAFSTYVAQLMVPIRQFGWIIGAVSQASVSSERIFEILDARSDVADEPDAEPIDSVSGRVTFERVSFEHVPGARVLHDIDLTVEPGESVALLGATGSGKSSIVSLIPRFYDPTEGRILIDGRDIRHVTVQSLRDNVGIVMQDTVLFSSTIRENIGFGRPGASLEEIQRAAEAARAADFIEALPERYDTRVGERGVTLSGGQRQRLSIARALLKDPRIIILDDATSSVDTETESHIQEALSRLIEGRTAFIIAQRLSTVRRADVVVVLENGKISAMARRSHGRSPHEVLIETSPLYADIYYGQLKDATSPADASDGSTEVSSGIAASRRQPS